MTSARLRHESHEVVHRTCPLCEAKCGISVEVDRSAGRVVTIRGDDGDSFSRGYLCPKAYGLKGLHEDADRLRKPLRREGSSWREIGWEEAFDFATRRLRSIREASGADAIATYLGNPNAHDVGSALYLPTFQRALGTRWRFSATSVDQLPKALSSCLLFGSPAAFPIPDIDRTQFLLVLGANPLVSNGSLMTAPDMPRRLAELRARGGTLVVVDPRRSETARIADQHLFIRPGTDALFLFSMVHVLFSENRVALGRLTDFTRGVDDVRALAADFSPEAVAPVTGIAPESVRDLARTFASAPRAACYGRIGTCTQEFGTLASWLVDVLNALTGNLDRLGGVMWPRPATSAGNGAPRRRGHIPYARWRSRVRGLPEFAGELPVAALAEEIDSASDAGRVRALVTVAGNPVLSTPNGARLAKALSSLEFMVSVDIYLNETTRFADLILPPTDPLEHSNYDLLFHGLSVHNHTKWSPAVFEPPTGAKHQWEILLELAAGMSGTTPEALDALVLGHLLGARVGTPQTPCPDVSLEEARRKLGASPGPDRLIDLMLRAGPYGDRFRDEAAGLSLAKLKAQLHGVDLGAMEPRLPDMLATESGQIELMHPLLRQDTERLREALLERREAPAMLLIGRRHLRSNNTWMHNLPSLAKGPERCTLLIHPDDAKRIGLADGDSACVKSRVGSIEAPVVVTQEMMPGVVSLPHGFGHDAQGMHLTVAKARPGVNSNLLADEALLDALSGNAVLNGIPVDVSAAG
jgi:anaerobic selenocysteine-containing dehydrogenase